MRPATLLILAAGLGTRYGGLKQLDPVGPSGELIMDYSIHDALQAGMDRVVFVVRRAMEDAFRARIGRRIEEQVETAYVHQEPDRCLPASIPMIHRSRPWGTGHALLVAREAIETPFVVINADDYYGRRSFRILADYFGASADDDRRHAAMVGYRLDDTLSAHGTVSRGVCRCTDRGELIAIEECRGLQPSAGGVTYADDEGQRQRLTGKEVVSMNIWGMTPDLFDLFEEAFHEFVQAPARERQGEFYLPTAMNRLVDDRQVTVRVLETPDEWFGVTYAQDKRTACRRIESLIGQGHYPAHLWGPS